MSRFVRAAGLVAVILVSALMLPTAPNRAEEAMTLTLREALVTALENNFDLYLAALDPEIAEQNVIAAEAAFDATFNSSVSYFDQTQEVTQISQPDSITATAGLQQNLRSGGNVGVELTASDTTLTGNPLFFGTSTTINTDLALTASIPLLGGRGTLVATEQIVLARGNLEISRDDFRRETEQTLERVEGAYWDVVAARAALEVAVKSLGRAEDLLEQNRKKVEVGTLAPIEITQAEAGVASEVESVIVAETGLQNAEDELRRLMAVPDGDPRWLMPVVPSDRPDFRPVDVELEAVIADALENRPEIRNARKSIENSELSERVAKRRLRNDLTLDLRFTPEGTDVDDLMSDASLVDALEETGELENRTWSVALNYSMPIGNRAAKADYAIRQLETRRSRAALDSQDLAIRVEARLAVRDIRSAVKRYEAATTNVRLQREKLEAEQKKFENGMSTSFEVLTFQNDLANAELSQIQALLDYQKALVALQRVRGTLLDARGLRIAAATD